MQNDLKLLYILLFAISMDTMVYTKFTWYKDMQHMV